MVVRYVKLMTVLGVLVSTQQVSAYIYSFSNHGAEPLRVRVQLAGAYEPWEERLIPPHKMVEFIWVPWLHPREKEGLNIFKAGFCLDNIQVALPLKKRVRAITPDGEDLGFIDETVKNAKGDVEFGPWASVNVKFVQNEGANAIIKASEEFANGIQDIAMSVGKAVAAAAGTQ